MRLHTTLVTFVGLLFAGALAALPARSDEPPPPGPAEVRQDPSASAGGAQEPPSLLPELGHVRMRELPRVAPILERLNAGSAELARTYREQTERLTVAIDCARSQRTPASLVTLARTLGAAFAAFDQRLAALEGLEAATQEQFAALEAEIAAWREGLQARRAQQQQAGAAATARAADLRSGLRDLARRWLDTRDPALEAELEQRRLELEALADDVAGSDASTVLLAAHERRVDEAARRYRRFASVVRTVATSARVARGRYAASRERADLAAVVWQQTGALSEGMREIEAGQRTADELRGCDETFRALMDHIRDVEGAVRDCELPAAAPADDELTRWARSLVEQDEPETAPAAPASR